MVTDASDPTPAAQVVIEHEEPSSPAGMVRPRRNDCDAALPTSQTLVGVCGAGTARWSSPSPASTKPERW